MTLKGFTILRNGIKLEIKRYANKLATNHEPTYENKSKIEFKDY